MRYVESLIELVGNTPLLKLGRVTDGAKALVLAKVEYLNPGGSVKDRIAVKMIEAAEREGKLKPGGTIVEPTSGNTGVGLAIVAQAKGYSCVFVCPDKVSEDKRNVLRRVRRPGRGLPDGGRARAPRFLLLDLGPAGPRDRGGVEARPVLQPEQPGQPLRVDRPGDLGADRGPDHPLRHRDRHRRDDQRRRPLPQGSRRTAGSRSSAPTRRARSTPAATAGRIWSRGSARTSGRPTTTESCATG